MNDTFGIKINCFVLAVFFLIGLFANIRKLALHLILQKRGIKTVTTVIKITKEKTTILSNSGETPFFQFQTKQKDIIIGVPLNFTSSNPSLYFVNDKYTIIYDEKNPEKFLVKNWRELAINISILVFLLFFISICIIGFFNY